jgi:vacuolar-type H+-ATPase subunit F/Vma7
MMKNKDLSIAILGNKDQTGLMRLAGIQTYAVFENDDRDLQQKVRKTLKEFLDDPSIGLIMVPDNWMAYVTDIVASIRKSKTRKAIVVEFPFRFDTAKQDVKEHYKAYTRNLIGFNVEI